MTNQVAKQQKEPKTAIGELKREDVKKRFYDMLGDKSNQFLVSVINTVKNNEQLKQAEPNSVLYAAATAASLDLPVDANLGFAYIIPYKDNKSGKTYAQFQLGYKGFIQLAQRSGQFKTISATPVYEGQLIEENPLDGFKFDWTNKSSDKVIGYAAYFSLINGFEKTLYMSIEDMKSHAQTYSKTYKFNSSTWQKNFDAMAQKTVIKLLLSKYAPLSTEMQKAERTDQAIVHDYEGNQIEYPDNRDVADVAIEAQSEAGTVDVNDNEKSERYGTH